MLTKEWVMLKNLVPNIDFSEFCICQVESKSIVQGVESGACSLESFSIKTFSYDAEVHLFSITLNRGFLVLEEADEVMLEQELECEEVEISFKFCLLKNCIISSSIRIFPGDHITSVCLKLNERKMS